MLENYGGGPSTRWYVEVGSRQYDQNVLVRAAHVNQGLGDLPPRGPGRFNVGQARRQARVGRGLTPSLHPATVRTCSELSSLDRPA